MPLGQYRFINYIHGKDTEQEARGCVIQVQVFEAVNHLQGRLAHHDARLIERLGLKGTTDVYDEHCHTRVSGLCLASGTATLSSFSKNTYTHACTNAYSDIYIITCMHPCNTHIYILYGSRAVSVCVCTHINTSLLLLIIVLLIIVIIVYHTTQLYYQMCTPVFDITTPQL